MRHGVDISNFTTLSQKQADYLRFTQDFVIIGLQSARSARDFKARLQGMELQYYVDIPGRDLTIPDAGAMVWIDIEVGCFQDAQQVREQGTANTAAGMVTGIYGNRASIPPVFGDSTELAAYGCPLWYADYRPPDFASFQPFNGWDKPLIWQYSSDGLLGINCDLNLMP